MIDEEFSVKKPTWGLGTFLDLRSLYQDWILDSEIKKYIQIKKIMTTGSFF